MTPLENLLKNITETAAELAKDDLAAERTFETTLEQRIAVGLIQARAQECRHQAGELEIKGLIRVPHFMAMRNHLLDRSSKLEAIGLEMVKQYPHGELVVA